MRRLTTGSIVLDSIDIICLSFSFGSAIAYLIRKDRERKNLDPIVTELKRKSRVIAFSVDGKPLKLPLMRGGETFKGLSLIIKNKKLAGLIKAIIDARRTQKLVKLLQINFAIFNAVLTSSVGLRFAVGGSLNSVQFILISVPSAAGGFLVGQIIANPLSTVFLPLAVMYGRGIEDMDIPNPYEKCKFLCKNAEEFHNKELIIEMKKLNSLVKDRATALELPVDEVHLVCVEEKLSLLQRYKLRKLIDNERVQKHVQHFNKFIKNFPDCDVDSEAVREEIVGKITE